MLQSGVLQAAPIWECFAMRPGRLRAVVTPLMQILNTRPSFFTWHLSCRVSLCVKQTMTCGNRISLQWSWGIRRGTEDTLMKSKYTMWITAPAAPPWRYVTFDGP